MTVQHSLFSIHSERRLSRYSAVRQSRAPGFIQLDPAWQGHSRILLKTLSRTFPPTSGSGYTLLLWLRLDELGCPATIPLITLSDASNRCFVRVSLETGSATLSFSSSLDITVSFSAYAFRPGRWYHVAIVHNRPRVSSSDVVTLYVDGKAIAAEKTLWPASPAAGFPVQLVIGMSRDDGDGTTTAKWSAGPCWMFDGDLGEDMIFVSHCHK
jgi:beige protein homolog 1